ncbi:hypothetical protein GCM10027570_37070 [Streptomonospora sediminis]
MGVRVRVWGGWSRRRVVRVDDHRSPGPMAQHPTEHRPQRAVPTTYTGTASPRPKRGSGGGWSRSAITGPQPDDSAPNEAPKAAGAPAPHIGADGEWSLP